MAKGAAIERTFDRHFGPLTAGELSIPLAPIVYDMDRGAVDYFGSEATPELTIGRLVRIAIALPVFIESVEVGGHLYVDGGIIDLLPAEPILADGGFDHVFGVNFMLPPQLEPDDITGWKDTPMGVLTASRQAEQGFQLELARRTPPRARRQLHGDRRRRPPAPARPRLLRPLHRPQPLAGADPRRLRPRHARARRLPVAVMQVAARVTPRPQEDPDPRAGLSSDAARRALAEHGQNVLAEAEPPHWAAALRAQPDPSVRAAAVGRRGARGRRRHARAVGRDRGRDRHQRRVQLRAGVPRGARGRGAGEDPAPPGARAP